MSLSAQTILQYSYLQLAADASGLQVDMKGDDLVRPLTLGNGRITAFTAAEAKTFAAAGWTVLAHKANTGTGFSGTLFSDKEGNRGLAFRSTEFADDAARDNRQTNSTDL